jgi:hypothetical protein
MCTRERYDIALSFWTASFQYLMLVENAAREIVAHGNTWIMMRDFGDGPITSEEYAEGTRWSDHTTVIPVLFNLLHGIELLIKGFMLTDPGDDPKQAHDIIDLCSRFSHRFPNEAVLNGFFHRYTCERAMPDILKRFLRDNRIDIRSVYQSLRYPSPNFRFMRDNSALKYHGEEGVHVFSHLQTEILEVRKSAVALGRALEPQGDQP